MTRRRTVLVSGLLAAAAVALGLLVQTLRPSPVQAEVDDLRACLEIRADEPPLQPVIAGEGKEIELDVQVYSFEMTAARTVIFADLAQPERSVQGIVKDDRRLEALDKLRRLAGYLNPLSMPRLTSANRQRALISVGTGVGPTFSGFEVFITPTLRQGDTVELDIELKLAEPGAPPLQAKSKLVSRNGQACFLGGLARPAERTVLLIPGGDKLPMIGSWRYRTTVMEEILVFVTPRIVPAEAEIWMRSK